MSRAALLAAALMVLLSACSQTDASADRNTKANKEERTSDYRY